MEANVRGPIKFVRGSGLPDLCTLCKHIFNLFFKQQYFDSKTVAQRKALQFTVGQNGKEVTKMNNF